MWIEMLTGSGGLLIVATAIPFFRLQHWWVRVFDFPRLQVAGGLALVLLLHLALVAPSWLAHGFHALLLLSLLAQARRMVWFTRLVRTQVQQSRTPEPKNGIQLMFANVLQTNRNAGALRGLIREVDPDLVLVLETDAWWQGELAALTESHPHSLQQPQDNTYGMLLFSRIPLIDPEVSFLIEPDVPSFHFQVRLGSGKAIQMHCLHPRPPAPAESDSSAPRDAELLIVGRAIKKDPMPVIVMGDLNDVAWSHTSELFRKISGLLDPRVGRGFFNTFNAKHWWIRFPLDHFFHSNDFRLVEFRRLARFGSDHFPVYIHLSHEPEAEIEQPELHADADEQCEAREKIAEVAPAGASMPT